jgi:hypothetical protein
LRTRICLSFFHSFCISFFTHSFLHSRPSIKNWQKFSKILHYDPWTKSYKDTNP